MSNLAGMLQVIGAGVAGYYQGKKSDDKEAEAKKDRELDRAYQAETRDRQRQDWEREDQKRNIIKDGQSDVAVEEIPGDAGYNLESMAGTGVPSTMPKPAPTGYKVGGQQFADRAMAEQAAQGLNTKLAKTKRTAEGLAPIDPEMAAKYEAHMKQLVAEGTVEALDAIASRAPTPQEIKAKGGKVASTLGQELADRFNSTGKMKVSPDTMVEYFTTKNAAGQETVNARVIGKDGKPVLDDVQGAYRTMLSVKERMAADQDEAKTFLTAQQHAEQARHNSAGERLDEKRTNASIADSAAQRGIQMAGLGLQRERLNMEKQSFKKQGLAGQIADIEEVTGVKLTAEEKKIMAGIKPGKGNKEADAVGAKIVESAVKTYQENTPNATTAQIATFRANLERDMVAARGNIEVDNALKADLGSKDTGSPEYARAWQEAQGIGLTEKDLLAKGYKPPAKTVPNPMRQVAATAGAGRAPARQAAAPKSEAIDLRADPTIVAINAGIAKLDPKDPRNVQQLMALGTAKNARIAQLRQNYGDQTPLLTE
jgi:hypothetical protein